MKKKIIIVSILVLVVVGLFAGLYIIDVYEILDKSGYVYGDGPVYESYEHIVNSANNVYEGLIESVSFDIFNLTTQDMYKGETMAEDERRNLAFVTIYKVKVDKVYQGRQADYYHIMVEGGIDGYEDFRQGVILKNAGLNYRSINSWGDLRGKKILFSTKDRGDIQSALSIPYAEYEVGSEKYQEFISYLSSEEYNNPPKTTKDIFILNEEVV